MEITNIDFSALLNMVDTFYSNAWNRLIILLAIVGVGWPVILKVYSDYRVKVKEEKLEKRLSEEIQNLNKKNLELINKKNDANMERLDKVICKKFENIERKLNVSKGNIHHLQGNFNFVKKQYRNALTSYFYAFNCYFDGKDELNLQSMIESIKNCYEDIKDLSLLIEVESQHSALIKKLDKINENARYENAMIDIKKEFDSAKKRLEKGKK